MSHQPARAASTPNARTWAVLTLGYMLPWAIATGRGQSKSGVIFWLNLLAGWTVVGWIAALVMAVAGEVPTTAAPPTAVAPAPVPPRTSAASAPCRSCHLTLWFAPARGWVHRTGSTWCDQAMTRQAQPALGG